MIPFVPLLISLKNKKKTVSVELLPISQFVEVRLVYGLDIIEFFILSVKFAWRLLPPVFWIFDLCTDFFNA